MSRLVHNSKMHFSRSESILILGRGIAFKYEYIQAEQKTWMASLYAYLLTLSLMTPRERNLQYLRQKISRLNIYRGSIMRSLSLL